MKGTSLSFNPKRMSDRTDQAEHIGIPNEHSDLRVLLSANDVDGRPTARHIENNLLGRLKMRFKWVRLRTWTRKACKGREVAKLLWEHLLCCTPSSYPQPNTITLTLTLAPALGRPALPTLTLSSALSRPALPTLTLSSALFYPYAHPKLSSYALLSNLYPKLTLYPYTLRPPIHISNSEHTQPWRRDERSKEGRTQRQRQRQRSEKEKKYNGKGKERRLGSLGAE